MAQGTMTMIATGRSGRGFSLIELMVAVAIVAILAFAAAPSMTRFVTDQRVKSAATDLYTAMVVARSEAIKLNVNVTLEKKTGGWDQGWTIPNPAGGAALLDQRSPIVPVTSLQNSVTYSPAGRIVQTNAAPEFTIGAAGNTQRCVTVSLSGRPHVKNAAC